jgi:hypothetical protein
MIKSPLNDIGVGGVGSIEVDVEEIECETVDWIQLALVNAVMNLQTPIKSR